MDYLTANELSGYPFKDNAELKATNSFVLANDVIADLMVIGKKAIRQAKLIAIANTSSIITLTIRGIFADGEQDQNISIAHGDIAKHKLISSSNSFFHIKLVLGSGFSSLVSAPVSSTFNSDILESCVIPPVPRVESITFNNTVEGLITQITGNELAVTNLTFEEGTNIAFSNLNNRLILIVNPGLGTGKHNPCDDDLVIKSINAITPDSFQNFLLTVDDCYETEKGFQDGLTWEPNFGITISNTCTPKCTSAQLSGFAHYLNRIRDGMETVGGQASDFNEELSDAITAFNSDTSRTAPIITAAVSVFDNPYGAPYQSFVVSFFNKSEEPLTANIAVPGKTGVTGTVRWKQGKTTEIVSSLTESTEVACHSQARFEFILQTTGNVTINASCGSTSYSNVFIV